MPGNIIEIPQSKETETDLGLSSFRVAAYCRVSTDT